MSDRYQTLGMSAALEKQQQRRQRSKYIVSCLLNLVFYRCQFTQGHWLNYWFARFGWCWCDRWHSSNKA